MVEMKRQQSLGVIQKCDALVDNTCADSRARVIGSMWIGAGNSYAYLSNLFFLLNFLHSRLGVPTVFHIGPSDLSLAIRWCKN